MHWLETPPALRDTDGPIRTEKTLAPKGNGRSDAFTPASPNRTAADRNAGGSLNPGRIFESFRRQALPFAHR